MTNYFGETLQFKETIKDFNGVTLIDPSSNEVKVYDPNGTLKATIPNAQISKDPITPQTGVFYAYYTLPSSGVESGTIKQDGTTVALNWYYVWKATFADSTIAIGVTEFQVAIP